MYEIVIIFLFIVGLSNAKDEFDNEAIIIYNRGVSCARDGNLQCSLEQYTSVLQKYPKFAQAWQNLGLVYEQLGDRNEAVRCHERAIELSPLDNPHFKCGSITNLANTLIARDGVGNTNTMETVINLLESYINSDICASHEEIYFALGKNLFDTQRYQAAHDIFQRLLILNPKLDAEISHTIVQLNETIQHE